MKFVSTNNQSAPVSLADAVNNCVAPDGGLFMPSSIPVIPKAFFNNISDMSLRDIAYVVATSFFGDDIPLPEIKNIVDDTFGFEAPLIQLDKDIFVLELFHGPTLTVKDYGARFMGRLLKALDNGRHIRRNVLVATTGNTGAAVANGLAGSEDINVFVLYPRGRLSRMAIKQFTSLGKNIYPLEVNGTVEDCKRLMYEAIADSTMSSFNLTGANSINIARLLPLVTLAYNAYARLVEMGVSDAGKAAYSIPCGNLSILVATVMAKRTGLPTGPLIAATNDNDTLVRLLAGESPDVNRAPVATLAPAIDMGYPAGWPRMTALYENNYVRLGKEVLSANPIDDRTITETVNEIRKKFSYTLDPHAAVAYAAARQTVRGVPKIIFGTGHPAKQLDIMTRITGSAIELPVQLTRFMSVSRHPEIIPPTLAALKKKISMHN